MELNDSDSSGITFDLLQKLIADIGPEPIGEFMAEKGFAPEAGGFLVLPESERERFGGCVPRYVKFSRFIQGEAFLINSLLPEAELAAQLAPSPIAICLPFPIFMGGCHA